MIILEERYLQNPSFQRSEAIDSTQVRNPWHQKMQQQSLQGGHTIKLCFRVFLLGKDDPIKNELLGDPTQERNKHTWKFMVKVETCCDNPKR